MLNMNLFRDKASMSNLTKTFFGFILGSFMCQPVLGQLGGTSTYSFLSLPNAARVASLGGKLVSVHDDDLNLAFQNPALLNQTMHNHLTFNYVGYFADTKFGYASYAHKTGKGIVAGGIHYINYGNFVQADPTGQITGNFTASEYALNIMYSRPLDSAISVGVNVKPVYNSLEKYSSFGMAFDLGVSYTNQNQLFNASLVLRNIGTQLVVYYKNADREPLPFDIQAGISQKLEHAPFRFFITAHNLQRFDLTYDENEEDELTFFNEGTGQKSDIEILTDKFMRHLIFGAEFTPFNNFYLRLGYNYQRRQELKIESRTAMVGFSWGFGLKINRFHLSYGRSTYHLAGASNHFSISTNLNEF